MIVRARKEKSGTATVWARPGCSAVLLVTCLVGFPRETSVTSSAVSAPPWFFAGLLITGLGGSRCETLVTSSRQASSQRGPARIVPDKTTQSNQNGVGAASETTPSRI